MAERAPDRGLLDTSVFIAIETGRQMRDLPDAAAISVVTIAELHLGVLMAAAGEERRRRLRTLSSVQNAFEPLPIDSEVARAFAEIVAAARSKGSRPKIMAVWIAATAVAHSIPVYTQDSDFLSIPLVVVKKI